MDIKHIEELKNFKTKNSTSISINFKPSPELLNLKKIEISLGKTKE